MSERVGGRARRSVAKWIVLAALGLAGFAAVKTGWFGFGWAQLKSMYWPRDEAILEWLPSGTAAVAIVDPHQIRLKDLAADPSSLGPTIVRIRGDVLKVTGVDLAFDVDKLAVAPNLAVLRGRFDGAALATKLAEYRYVKADYSGRSYLVRAGEDAVLVVDDFLVYGDENSLKAAIDAKDGASLAKDESFTSRLSRMGWNYPLLATISLADDRPSLRTLIAGATGPRAVTVGVRASSGVDVRAWVETGSATAAQDLAKTLDEQRARLAETLEPTAGAELAALLAGAAKDATVRVDPAAAQVEIRAHVRPDALDAIVRAAQNSSALGATAKALRLVQLLTPPAPH
jgi:hypothetical protein